MQELLVPEESSMSLQDEKIKGLERVTEELRRDFSALDGSFKALSKTVEDSKHTHWAIPVLIMVALAWMGWLSLQVISQGNKLTAIGTILSPQETLKHLTSAVSPDPVPSAS